MRTEFRGYLLPTGFTVSCDIIFDANRRIWTLALDWAGKIVLFSTQGETRAVDLAA
jgi:hypothetical protein